MRHPRSPIIDIDDTTSRVVLFGKWEDEICLIDRDDSVLVGQYRWHGIQRERKVYVESSPTRRLNIRLHRLLMGEPLGKEVDHIDHDPLNNRKLNLRIATQHQNRMNTISIRNSSSSYLGVSWCRERNKWYCQIEHNYRNIHIGRFDSEEEAARAYDEVALRLRGEFANLNFPIREDLPICV